MKWRCWIRRLLMLAIGLPLAQVTLLWVSSLLLAMGDERAGSVIKLASTAIGAAWLVTIVGLVVVMAAKALDEPPAEAE
jgi:hypothetical protein